MTDTEHSTTSSSNEEEEDKFWPVKSDHKAESISSSGSFLVKAVLPGKTLLAYFLVTSYM